MPTIRSRILKHQLGNRIRVCAFGLNANDPFEDTETPGIENSIVENYYSLNANDPFEDTETFYSSARP